MWTETRFHQLFQGQKKLSLQSLNYIANKNMKQIVYNERRPLEINPQQAAESSSDEDEDDNDNTQESDSPGDTDIESLVTSLRPEMKMIKQQLKQGQVDQADNIQIGEKDTFSSAREDKTDEFNIYTVVCLILYNYIHVFSMIRHMALYFHLTILNNCICIETLFGKIKKLI